MAQTIQEIEDSIDAQVAAAPELVDLNSTSNIALYKVYRKCIAFILNLFQRQQDDYQAAIQTTVEQKQFGTDPWWQQTMLAYQHGDLLQFINNFFQYAAIDTTKQVINLCSVKGQGGLALLKCATLVDGVPQVLTDDEIAGAQSYAEEQRPCGITPVVQSFPADMLKLFLKIYYNPQGDLPTIKSQVEAAITNYLDTIDFDGVLYINKLIDAIQAIPAVINDQVFVVEVAAKPSTGAYADIVSSYQAEAGYFIVDPDFPLSTTLTYVAA
jgi:hypothetical protein